MHEYCVYFTIKANRKQYYNCLWVEAKTAKEARDKCKLEVTKRTGRNAFNPTTVAPHNYDNMEHFPMDNSKVVADVKTD